MSVPSDVRVAADFLEFEPNDMLDRVPPPPVVSSTTVPLRGVLLLLRQRFTRAYSVCAVHVAFVIFIATTTGTFNLIAYSRDNWSAALKKNKKHTKFTMWHTKLKALSFGSSRSKSFNGRTHASIESGGGWAAVVCSSEAVESVGVITSNLVRSKF